jgi:uncharacterized membrane protein YkvA (DUF1232 family)
MLKGVVNQVWLTWKLLLDKRVPTWMKLLLAIPFLYVLSPIDLLPDFILGLGQLDDLGIILLGMRIFESIVPEYIVQEHRAVIAKSGGADGMIEGKNYTVRKGDGEKANP